MIALLHLAPLLVVLAALWRGRYPGETRILALTARRRLRRPVARRAPRRGSVRALPRGGGLIAGGLAGRAPPALSRA
jgi:hypothetical protein